MILNSDEESVVSCLLFATASQNIQVQFANASVSVDAIMDRR